jgi:tetratricopeptide (TPR) repeat protein
MTTFKTTVSARLHYRTGRFLRLLGWARGAARAFADAAAENPLWADARFEQGLALAAAGDWQDATEILTQALRLRPEDAEGWGNLALCLSKAGRAKEAIGALQSMARLRPNDVDIQLLLGTLYRRAGRQEEAVRSFRLSVRLPLPPSHVRFQLGEAMVGGSAWQDVRDAYVSAAEVVPPSAAVAIPAGHSCLNEHPERTPREFRRILPRPQRTANVPFHRRPLRLPTLGFLRRALRGPGLAWGFLLALPKALRPRQSAVRSFPARPHATRHDSRPFWPGNNVQDVDSHRRLG